MLLATTDGDLVCVAAHTHPDVTATFADLGGELAGDSYRAGVGRAHPGLGGVAASYREARQALTLADRLGWPGPVVHARDMVVYQVITRGRDAIADLVTVVLEPLRRARGGARPLLDTLSAYFDADSAAAAGRHLHLGTRTVTYRLQRIKQLTGYDATDPAQRYPLRTAVLGALVLGWPELPLDQDR